VFFLKPIFDTAEAYDQSAALAAFSIRDATSFEPVEKRPAESCSYGAFMRRILLTHQAR
jgi:hypothetical protein